MKKVLQYIPSYKYGGIESFTYDLNRELSNKYHFYYLVEKDLDNSTAKKLKLLGADVIRIPNMTSEGFLRHLKSVRKVFKNNKFDIVHVHDCNNRFFVMMEAYFHGVKKRLYHVHSQSISGSAPKRFLKGIGLKINLLFSTDCLSCSREAAEAKKIKKYTIINNGISVNDFKYNANSRNELRKKYNIPKNAVVLLFVGRVEKIKNIGYLIDVLAEIPDEIRDKYFLMIVGDGTELGNIKRKVSEMKKINVVFAGSQVDLSPYYSASDIFCLPSFNEGFSIVSLEAQASGLKCLVSKNVPGVVNATGLVTFLDIDSSNVDEWVEKILLSIVPDNGRQKYIRRIERSDFSSSRVANKINSMYGGLI